MKTIVVNGPCRLQGEVTVSGAKNAAVAILPATLLVNGKCHLENVPNISDIRAYIQILESLGSKIEYITDNELIIDNSNIKTTKAPYDLTSKFRASYYLLGALLGRFGTAQISLPGGCNIGARPIDQHIRAFEALGSNVIVKHGNVYANSKGLKAAPIFFDVVTVGATINAILAATLAEGVTVIENCAKEPHVVDVANFLNSVGAKIKGAGTDVIRVTGVKALKQTSSYAVIPDQIEAGTFMVAAAATRGDVLIKNCIPRHLEPITAKLTQSGAIVEEFEDSIRVSMDSRPSPVNIKTLPYPGFPTDMQPQFATYLALSTGSSMIVENIWESRFQYTAELIKMGAKISYHDRTAMITGVSELYGSPVTSLDLRAGAAMIIAGLMANGYTEIQDIKHIERGYENIVEKFKQLGADISYSESEE
ncbi:MAG: UDP-N-acetylglucosamine 1-carboxyvinyltransferase [Clostridia bacterium]|nr:UDP-N-acetylglucosamine 1-carboxyvinyltransferase [Clostridia bacterium]